MNETINKLRPDLTPLPDRMKHLSIDERGYVVPFFVPMVNGKPEFRCMAAGTFARAIRNELCWVCGGPLGIWKTFVTGPMCVITGTNSEPPSHWVCATWSAKNCPFLSKPQMTRRENDLPEERTDPGGISIPRNPGVVGVLTTRTFELFDDGNGKPLIHMGDVEHLEWFALGRAATRAEVQHSVDTGLPILLKLAKEQGIEAVQELDRRVQAFASLLPAE
jgi:hypothetical protein